MELGDGSSWRLAASTLDGGVGSSNSLAFVDEAWNVDERAVDGSLAPTLAERESSQLVLVSTAGDGRSALLRRDRDAAIVQAADPDTARILLLEWSADPTADYGDREAWRAASPHWTERRARAVEDAYHTVSESEFRRQWLNQWVLAASAWLQPGQWRVGERTELELPARPAGTVAVEIATDASAYGAVLAVADAAGNVYLRSRLFTARGELFTWLAELGAQRRGLRLIVPPSLRNDIPPAVRAELVVAGQAEQYAGYGATVAAALEGRLLHAGEPDLTTHVLRAATVSTPDRGTALYSKGSPGPIFLARALVWAVAAELRPGRSKVIISGA